MTQPDATIEAMAIFGRVLQRVNDDHLQLDTPCSDWDVEALISHVLLGDAATQLFFTGQPLPESAAVDTSILGPNPMATWRGTALSAIDAMRAEGAMETEIDYFGRSHPGEVVAGFRLVDVLVHAWDLATAIGVDPEIPDELAEGALEFLFPRVEELRASSGLFAPAIEPPDSASALVRLLALLGRRAF